MDTNEHDAITAPMEITRTNAMEVLQGRLYKLQAANRRYEANTRDRIQMRETDWNRRRIKAEWSLFTAQLVKQDYRCACCRCDIDERACVHTDNEGNVRGILCFRCNVILAYAKDDCYMLLKALVYLLEDR